MPGSELARRRVLAPLIALAATALICFLVLGGGDGSDGGDGGPAAALDADPAVLDRLAGLDDAAKAGQLILSGFEGRTEEDVRAPFPGALHPGGLIVAASNWPGEGAGAELIAAISRAEDAEGVAPLIAVAQEGGSYRALEDLPPGARAIEVGDSGDPELARRWGRDTATALAEVGASLDLGTIADIATLDSPIADRAFSDDPASATAMSGAAVRGCLEAEIGCAVSHFPGEGAVSESTAQGPGSVSLDRATLAERELAPFEAALDAGGQVVIVSHALYSAYDPVTPASLSEPIYRELLRGRAGFEGVAITDDLQAGAIRAGLRVEDAAVSAIAAGADMVQISDPAAAHRAGEALVAAIEEGALDPERVDEAVARVLTLKQELGLID